MAFCLTRKISWQIYRDVVYVFNEETKKAYLFSDSAKDFWFAIINFHISEEAIHNLCALYGADNKEEITNDFQDFLSALIAHGVLQEDA